MGNDELLNYISMFREKAEQGKLVIFVGAGVSCNVDGMPSWNALIQNMAKAIDYSRCDTCRHRLESCENTCLLKDDFSTDELLKVPQHVFNKDQELYYRILNESIPAVTADAPLSSAIFDINPAHIITTNYDQLLESSKNIFCEQYQVIVYDKDYIYICRLLCHKGNFCHICLEIMRQTVFCRVALFINTTVSSGVLVLKGDSGFACISASRTNFIISLANDYERVI